MRELSLHILDIVQNSLAADACNISITIIEDSCHNDLMIEITDDGRGMDKQVLQKALDPFYTTRTTRKVGLGLALFGANARQCGGEIKVSSVPGKGTKVQANFQYDHIDRAPLGDMTLTLLTLIGGAPQVDFFYLHRCDDKSFSFSTIEIKEYLQGVSINNPEVLSWLKDYLTEKEKEINKPAII